MSKRVMLNNATLANLLRSKDTIRQLPQLRAASKRMKSARGCNCGGKRVRQRNSALEDAKMAIRGWDIGLKNKLKKLLSADTVEMYVGKQLVRF